MDDMLLLSGLVVLSWYIQQWMVWNVNVWIRGLKLRAKWRLIKKPKDPLGFALWCWCHSGGIWTL